MDEHDYLLFALSATFVAYKAMTTAAKTSYGQPPSMAGLLATLAACAVLGYEVIVIASRLF